MSRFSLSRSDRFILASLGLTQLLCCSVSRAGDFASSVIQYTSGTLAGTDAPFNDPAAALGPMTDNTQYGSLNPFNPPFQPPGQGSAHGQIVIIGPGGSLTLKLQSPVKTAGGYLGVFVNNGLIDVSADGSGQADSNADTFSDYPQSFVGVSDNPDPKTAVPLGAGAATFYNPSNLWSDLPPYTFYTPTPGRTLADESQPFLGGPSDFNNLTMPQILTLLNGSAGGTWLPLSNAGIPSEIQYVTFTVPAGADYRMVVDAVSAVPEPGTAIVGAGGVVVLVARRRRGK